MARKKRKWDKQSFDKHLAAGKGKGELSSYKPWIEVRDFPSIGMSNRVYGITTNRVHHFLSSLELAYFYILVWSKRIVDIREQYPILDLLSIIEIAGKAGIRYPFDKVSGFPYTLISDFYIIATKECCVRSIERRKDIEKQRTREKLEIERRYW